MTPALPGRRALVSVWVVAAVALGSLVTLAENARGPLDDPDPAQQRPGFLDGFDLPAPAPRVDPLVPRQGRRAVVFFERRARLVELCPALEGSDLFDAADVAVVVAGAEVGAEIDCGGATVVADPSGQIADAFALRRPAGGGPPTGYAVVDRDGQIRYRTIDPSAADELGEVRTIVDATP